MVSVEMSTLEVAVALLNYECGSDLSERTLRRRSFRAHQKKLPKTAPMKNPPKNPMLNIHTPKDSKC